MTANPAVRIAEEARLGPTLNAVAEIMAEHDEAWRTDFESHREDVEAEVASYDNVNWPITLAIAPDDELTREAAEAIAERLAELDGVEMAE